MARAHLTLIGRGLHRIYRICREMAGVTGLEPAASGVTGQRSNQLSYTPATARFIINAAGTRKCVISLYSRYLHKFLKDR